MSGGNHHIVPIAPVTAAEIARAVDGLLVGTDCPVTTVRPASALAHGALSFAIGRKIQLDPEAGAIILVARGHVGSDRNTYIEVDNPRLAFAKALAKFFQGRPHASVAASARVAQGAQIHATAIIGEYVVIEDAVTIGARSIVQHGAVLHAGTRLGDDCVIAAGAVIGSSGFGYERDAAGIPQGIPHLGGVSIGRDVHVGSNCTIARGTLTDTVIGDHTKIGAQVNIQHNAVIGKSCIIASQAQISGSVRIEDECWIGPNSTLRETRIGARAVIGLGALVLTDVPAGTSVMGYASHPVGELAKHELVSPASDRMQASFAGQAAAADNFDELFVQMVRRILKLKQSFAISDGLTPRDVPGWDSVSNVDLLLESQRMFDVRLDIDAMAAIRSLGDLRAALKRQLPNAR